MLLRVILFTLLAACLWLLPRFGWPGASEPPNWIVQLSVSFTDPHTGGKKTYTTDSLRGARRESIRVAAGSRVVLQVSAYNMGGNPGSDGVSLDIWYDWPSRRTPTDSSLADVVCIPESPVDCLEKTISLKADLAFEGKAGRGIYNIAAWVDRFDTVSEFDEMDNFLGPVRITVLPTLPRKTAPLAPAPRTLAPLRPRIEAD
ncbi:MAG: hypothetical protein Kow006_08950 [Gammaproteobacteria bacterium]